MTPIQQPTPQPQLPPATVEVDVDMLQELVTLIGKFPNATVSDCVRPLLYISRVVTEANAKRQDKFKAEFAAKAVEEYKRRQEEAEAPAEAS